MTDRIPSNEMHATSSGSEAAGAARSNYWLPQFVQQTMTERSGRSAESGEQLLRQLRDVLLQGREANSSLPRGAYDANSLFGRHDHLATSHRSTNAPAAAPATGRSMSDSMTNGVTIIDVDMSPSSPLLNQSREEDDFSSEQAAERDNDDEPIRTSEGFIRGIRQLNERMNRPDTPVFCLLYIIVFIPFLVLVLLKNIFDSFNESLAFLVVVVGHVCMSQLFSESGTRGIKFWLFMGAYMFVTYETFAHMDALEFLKDSMMFKIVPSADDAPRFASVLYVVVVTCYMAKTVFLIAKLVVSLAPFFSEKRKRRLYQWLEYTCILYCDLLPFPQWLRYFNNTLFFMMYVLLKFFLSSRMIRSWIVNTRYLFRLTTVGSIPSEEDLRPLKDDNCSICCCQFVQPIKLSCNHIFCEECVSTWLDKQDTCPICRQKMTTEDNKYKNGESQLIPTFY
ncbi:hypothetical protein L596_004040 [Steinernema carpocapsae]|uniref:RING-type domain-containing protein n=1 Tax=Steinernema carpocapsae TaxID=34508 RepID=A0A4U8UW38_STECR|nr:hypothetical protein L596_004040 [Steinernema carpocapsae]